MKGNFYPPEGHDFVPTQEIRELENYNDFLCEDMFLSHLANIRIKILDHLISIDALGEDNTIAVYQIPNDYISDGSSLPQISDILLMTDRIDEENPKSIRIVSNEFVSVIKNRASFLIEDITIDNEDDCQYRLDSASIKDGNFENLPFSPFYMIKEGKIVIIEETFCAFTAVSEIEELNEDDSIKQIIYPFGVYYDLFDSMYAMKKANELVDKIVDKIPIALQVDGKVINI